MLLLVLLMPMLLLMFAAVTDAVVAVCYCSSELGRLGGGGDGGAGRVQGAGHERQPFQAHAGRAGNFPRRASSQGSLGRSSTAKRGTLDGDHVHFLVFSTRIGMISTS